MTIQDFQPYLTAIVQAAAGLLTLVVLAGIRMLRQQTLAWLDARKKDSDRSTLRQIASEAFALAESSLGSGSGPWKLTAASGYVADRLGKLGIEAEPAEIRAAIEQAVLQYNAVVKTGQAGGTAPSPDQAPNRAQAANRAG